MAADGRRWIAASAYHGEAAVGGEALRAQTIATTAEMTTATVGAVAGRTTEREADVEEVGTVQQEDVEEEVVVVGEVGTVTTTDMSNEVKAPPRRGTATRASRATRGGCRAIERTENAIVGAFASESVAAPAETSEIEYPAVGVPVVMTGTGDGEGGVGVGEVEQMCAAMAATSAGVVVDAAARVGGTGRPECGHQSLGVAGDRERGGKGVGSTMRQTDSSAAVVRAISDMAMNSTRMREMMRRLPSSLLRRTG